jgi:hypothetical protein
VHVIDSAEELLRGEDPEARDPEDVEHWIVAYTELLTECERLGLPSDRFARRLDYWLRVRAEGGTPPA